MTFEKAFQLLCKHYNAKLYVASARNYKDFFGFFVSSKPLKKNKPVFTGPMICVMKKTGSVVNSNDLDFRIANLPWTPITDK